MDLPVTTLCNHILIYIGLAVTTATDDLTFYNYGDQVTGDYCLVQDGTNVDATCSNAIVTTEVNNCLIYATATTCLICKTGFFVDGISCTECITNCASCTTSSDCTLCLNEADDYATPSC